MEKLEGRIRFWGIVIILPLLAFLLGVVPALGKWNTVCRQKRLARQATEKSGRGEVSAHTGRKGEKILSNGVILKILEKECYKNQIRVVGYSPCFTQRAGGRELYSGELVLEGGFIPLLKVVGFLQHQPGLRIVSLTYKTRKDPAAKVVKLGLTLCLQAVEDGN